MSRCVTVSNCINKKMTCKDLQDAIDMIHDAGMYVYENIGIGIDAESNMLLGGFVSTTILALDVTPVI